MIPLIRGRCSFWGSLLGLAIAGLLLLAVVLLQ